MGQVILAKKGLGLVSSVVSADNSAIERPVKYGCQGANVRLSSSPYGPKYWVTYGLGICVLGYFSIAGYLWSTQVEQILRPIPGNPDVTSIEANGGEYWEIPVSGADGLQRLRAIYIPAAEADAPVVMMFHGQGTTIERELDRTDCFRDIGCHCLLVEYRGYGSSYGEFRPSEASLCQDAQSALDYLREHQEFATQSIFVFGHSLGGGVAFSLAERNPDIAGLIVESTFTSVLDMSSLEYNGWLNVLPVSVLLTERFDSHSKVPNLQVPLLVVHGTDDQRIPLDMAKQLHRSAKSRKRICVIDGAGHANCFYVGGDEYRQAIESFIDECVLASPLVSAR